MYRIADIYKTVEQEAYDILGKKVILIRFVFPTGLKHSHLLPERDVPATDQTFEAVLEAVKDLDPEGKTAVHFIEDDPVLCGAEHLIKPLFGAGHPLYLNTCGFFHIGKKNVDLLTSLYVQTKPGLPADPYLLEKAREIRAYWKPGDAEYTAHVAHMDSMGDHLGRDRMFLVPYNVDLETVQATLAEAMRIGWRFGLRLSSVAPESDKFLQNEPRAEEVYHKRYRDALGIPDADFVRMTRSTETDDAV